MSNEMRCVWPSSQLTRTRPSLAAPAACDVCAWFVGSFPLLLDMWEATTGTRGPAPPPLPKRMKALSVATRLARAGPTSLGSGWVGDEHIYQCQADTGALGRGSPGAATPGTLSPLPAGSRRPFR